MRLVAPIHKQHHGIDVSKAFNCPGRTEVAGAPLSQQRQGCRESPVSIWTCCWGGGERDAPAAVTGKQLHKQLHDTNVAKGLTVRQAAPYACPATLSLVKPIAKICGDWRNLRLNQSLMSKLENGHEIEKLSVLGLYQLDPIRCLQQMPLLRQGVKTVAGLGMSQQIFAVVAITRKSR